MEATDDALKRLDEEMEELAEAAERQPKSSLVISFAMDAIENPEKTKDKGRPIFDDVEMISIRIPGDPDMRRRPVRPEDRQQYAKQYLAWKRNQAQESASGTPLAEWPPIKRSQAEEAKFLGIHTIEQLADVADVHLQRLGPGWLALRQKARDWLKEAQGGAELGKLRTELEDANHRIKVMEEMLAKQAAEIQGKVEATPHVVAPSSEVAELRAMVEKMIATKAEPLKVRRKPGPKSKAEKAAIAAANGEG